MSPPETGANGGPSSGNSPPRPQNGSSLPSSPPAAITTQITTTTTSPPSPSSPPATTTTTTLDLSLDHTHSDLIATDLDFSCGIGRWRLPPLLQRRFANKQCFLALFCLTSVLQGVYYTYFVSVLTTIEKLYQIPSKTTGMIMSSTEIGQISGALLLTYYGGQGHRPRWIATGMLVFAAAALLCSTPHYLFGSSPTQSVSPLVTSPLASSTLCSSSSSSGSLPNSSSSSSFSSLIFDSAGSSSSCLESEVIVRKNLVTNSVLAVFFMSLLLIGLGTTAVNTLGIPYIDDNVAPKESPLYFGITIGVRIFGPVCGFLLGSICTSIPVTFPFGGTDLKPADANWIGAWWLGLFLVGISLALTSLPMMIFPRRLPAPDPSSYCHQQQQKSLLEHKERLLLELEASQQQQQQQNSQLNTEVPLALEYTDAEEKINSNGNHSSLNSSNSKKPSKKQKTKNSSENRPSLSGFSVALKRLLKNDILLCRTASSVLHILPISGLYTFLPKYLESQFQLTASEANAIAGLAGILVMGFGVFFSGIFMRKYKPSAKYVARWLAFAALAYVVGMTMLMFLGCPTNSYAGLSAQKEDGNDFFYGPSGPGEPLTCSGECACPKGKFEPVCLKGGKVTFISPCTAGCTAFQNSTKEKLYLDCSCSSAYLPPNNTQNHQIIKKESSIMASTLAEAIPGLCPLHCSTLTFYTIIFSITVLIHSTSEVGSMLLTLRCVEPQDKAMALGFISFATGLFGNVPCPIIYGAIVDSTCLFWEEDSCGRKGACRIYDSTRFRQWFHGITAFIMFLAFVIDVVVCFKADAIQFHEEVAAPDPEREVNKNKEEDGVVTTPLSLESTEEQNNSKKPLMAKGNGSRNGESAC